MAKDDPRSAADEISPERNVEAQSTFATSTLVPDLEKNSGPKSAATASQHKSIYGSVIDISCSKTGSGAVFEAKAQLLNQALLDIGMGRYQWLLLTITSVGWFLVSFWTASFTVINPAAADEAQFFFSGDKSAYLPLSLFVGLTAGAATWPWMSDTLGRKWILTSTIVLMGVGGLVGAGMPSFTGLCVVGCVIGIAIGGNQIIDGIILVETLPASHQFLVAMQGLFWGVGQLVSYAIGWAFVAEYTCGTGPDAVSTEQALGGHSKRAGSGGGDSCHYVSNKGWRYFWWTCGCITLFLYLCRFFFLLRETPKHLLARRRDAEATQNVKDIAAYNKRQTWLTEASFARIDSTVDAAEAWAQPRVRAVVLSLGAVGFPVLLLLWVVTGLTFLLHKTYISNYLASRGISAVTPRSATTDHLFSRYLYTAICAIPGPIVAALLIEVRGLGRKRTGALIALLTGLFMLIATLARSQNAALAFNCILSFLEFAGLAVLTTYTVEAFPSPVRGSGFAVMGFSWGLFGLVAQIVNVLAESSVAGGGPVWFCGAVWIVMVGAWLALPLETQSRAAA
ncbi:major facilitator superfamily domain-containing protein [Aspergillus stella-maris]|uniref:major facilitator superfamily domain-containing protein n=1 Tax=Aspergillus stella-maris TaxID=1810926 RepID=UPI003CCDAD82